VRPRLRLDVGALTDVGKVRDHNEDAWLWVEQAELVAVADGMGGHEAGDVASELTVRTLARAFEHGLPEPRRLRALLRRRAPAMDHLERVLHEANRAVLDFANDHPACKGMGTTVVAMLLDGRHLHRAHVGDSRIYRLRDGELTRLTQDHSLLNEYLRLGVIGPEKAAHFPYKNVIVRALGLSPNVDVDLATDTVILRDRYLLCSDGLTDLVDDETIRRQLQQLGRPAADARALVDLALAAGGSDNVTAVVADVVTEDS
jgi:serine/threonine protein phosphatase PrpC